MFRTFYWDESKLRDKRKTLPRRIRWQVIIEFWDERDHIPSIASPETKILICRCAKRRTQEDQSLDCTISSMAQGKVRTKRPTQDPYRLRGEPLLRECDDCFDVVSLALTTVEFTTTLSECALGSARVEADDSDRCHRGQSIGGLSDDVAIHHPAVRGKWMESDERGDCRCEGCGDLTHEIQTIFGLDRDHFAL